MASLKVGPTNSQAHIGQRFPANACRFKIKPYLRKCKVKEINFEMIQYLIQPHQLYKQRIIFHR